MCNAGQMQQANIWTQFPSNVKLHPEDIQCDRKLQFLVSRTDEIKEGGRPEKWSFPQSNNNITASDLCFQYSAPQSFYFLFIWAVPKCMERISERIFNIWLSLFLKYQILIISSLLDLFCFTSWSPIMSNQTETADWMIRFPQKAYKRYMCMLLPFLVWRKVGHLTGEEALRGWSDAWQKKMLPQGEALCWSVPSTHQTRSQHHLTKTGVGRRSRGAAF